MRKRKRNKRKKGTSLYAIVAVVLIVTIAFSVIVRAFTYSPLPQSDSFLQTSVDTSTGVSGSGDEAINLKDQTVDNELTESEEKEDEDVKKIQAADIRSVSLTEQAIIPMEMSNYRIEYTGFSMSYNLATHCPNWVAWELTDSETRGTHGRTNDYRSDHNLPFEHRVDERAFSPKNYDRGHMCPAGDMKWSEQSMSDTFYMTNMCPQAPTLNQTWWEHLESACRRWAQNEGSVYICCGPIFTGEEEEIGYSTKVRIPSAFFKVVLSLKKGKEKAIGFYYKNDNSRQPMGGAVKTVDEIEEMTGMDFFSLLPDELEDKVESISKLNNWQ